MKKTAHLLKLHHRELQSSQTGEKYSFSADLSSLLGLKDLFIHHEIFRQDADRLEHISIAIRLAVCVDPNGVGIAFADRLT